MKSSLLIEQRAENMAQASKPSQLSGYPQEDMSLESKFDSYKIKRSQAISSDYSNTGYDRGHLNPKSFQRDEGRAATFTLTNAAPMDPCFNRVRWYQWESTLKTLLSTEMMECPFATAYLVTGTVPHPHYRIPQREFSESHDFERVTVPSHVWTAVCFIHPFDNKKSFSLGYMGTNEPDSTVRLMTVPQINDELSVTVFADDCFFANRKSKEVREQMKAKIRQPVKLKATEDRLIFAQVSFPSMYTYFQETERMKEERRRACVVNDVKGQVFEPVDLKKRDMDERTDAVQCQQVLEKSEAAAMTASDGTRCQSGERYCKTESGFKPCCTSPCLYQEQLKGYWCSSGQAQIQCSPQYSAITVKGKNCKEDHPCATYGKDYYWCKVPGLLTSWDYCSPPLWRSRAKNGRYCRPNHACAKYGESYYWCYFDSDNNWSHCCTHDDCFSAVNGKTCKQDHPCGYYKKSYLWCYTTDGNWEYCCKQ
ncbi:hypothetical protein NFI96_004433 [Prochilodus magdalenae]|nr:hypothetical protein NFI96_004433 [Prochilodus magdalenae]